MPLDKAKAGQYLKEFNFKPLFIELLGWDKHEQHLPVEIDGKTYKLTAIAHKRGMVAFECPYEGAQPPDYPIRRKIDQQVTKNVREHFIIYSDSARTLQIWQWVKREAGKPTACREHHFHRNQSGEALIQKLEAIKVGLDEEEQLTIVEVAGKAKAAFDVEKITKRFYDLFKTEHDGFLKFIKGIPDAEFQQWYASVMLNRLMFIYFIQKKGFLDGNTDYLRTKLASSKERGKDRFYTDFLSPLFFEGFAKKETDRSAAINKLLGKIPYLNGGLFLKHQIEELYGKHIHISDAAFEKIFAFFDQYQWHLDERLRKADNEINPDVLGYIFEKYINQKQMGAYYTKEDITEFISKNTVIPYLFDVAKQKCKIAFEGNNSIWRLLQVDPDRYIYDAVKKGVGLPLPEEIAKGLKDVVNRTELGWNKPATSEYALPTEIWREVVARRRRYEEVRAKLASGEVRDINAFITYNLNIRQFAHDVIENSEGPELLRAFYHAIEKVTVLDPTCGSGAFLFAALNILEPLYEACLDRMEVFLSELERSGEKHRPEKYSDFKKILEQVGKHQNRKYFIFKSIIVNNLYGVDIMEEAIEICKLRLFLKLVAQVDDTSKIEPLPDIDFNVRAGNTLVGYATYDEVKHAVTSKLDFDNAMEKIKEQAEDIDRLFKLFHQQQTEIGGEVTAENKQELRSRLQKMEDKLNRYLATEYGIEIEKKGKLEAWLHSHKPFHWFIVFYGIVKNGGFDVIIGNPPFLELREVDYSPHNFRSIDSGAIHAMCVEQSMRLLNTKGCISMIFPMSLVSTQRMKVVQDVLEESNNLFYANFAWRPAKLFDAVNRAINIFLATPHYSTEGHTYSTNYQKWTSDNRDLLIPLMRFVEVQRKRNLFWVPKLGHDIEKNILTKVQNVKTLLGRFFSRNGHRVYYRTTGGLYWKVFTDFAPVFWANGKKGHSTRETCFILADSRLSMPAIAILSSDIFWWWYTISTTCRDLNPYDLQNFPVPETALKDQSVAKLGAKYLDDLQENSTILVRQQKQTGETKTQSFKIQKSKPIIDDIDRVLAKHYGFTDEELDFIINYDIKYRMGRDSQEEVDD